MEKEIACRRVALRPLELLYGAKDLLGQQYWLFVFPLIAERGLKAVPAIKTSYRGS